MAHPMEVNFCRRCGSPISQKVGHGHICQNGHALFLNQSPSVGIFFITAGNHVLLSERGIEPHKGKLDAFGGFIDPDDSSLEAASARELMEELSLEPDEYEPLRYLGSASSPYPYQDEDIQVMSTLYWTRLKTGRALTPSDDVAAIHSLPLHEVALDTLHADDIRLGIQKLQELFPNTIR
jgi:ADP-ribose pyrophosphatase YjhB (NUDIX family)